LESLYSKDKLNALNLYVYGVALKQRNKKEQAKKVLVEALNKFPLLWSAWIELNSLCKREDYPLFESIRSHWVKNFFLGSFYIQIQQEEDSIGFNSKLIEHFRTSVHIINEIAHACYINQQFDHALSMFKKLKKMDPYRYEDMDLYSNILYIKEEYGELANLAYEIFQNNKYRPETCCVLGNYYSLRGDHEKAVLYFR
jgi:anaphase-promoting complex subunit 8